MTATTRIGSLSSTSSSATDGALGGSGSTYEIGYLNENTTFYGLFTAAKIVKVGDGRLTLRTPGHTSAITIQGGTLELNNTTSTKFASSTITIAKGGTLAGTALSPAVVVKQGGTVTGGLAASTSGTLRIDGNLTLQTGATTLVRLGSSDNSCIAVSGTISHQSDTILIHVPQGRRLNIGDEIVVYMPGFKSATGLPVVRCQGEVSYTFDTSLLNTEGKLVVTGVSAISHLSADGQPTVSVYTVDGILLRTDVDPSHALDGLPSGIYIVGNRLIRKK